jgi:hypothetical protein
MIRIAVVLVLFFAGFSSAAAADRWVFDPGSKTASISKGSSALIVACAGRGVGLMYQVEKSAAPAALRQTKNTVFAFSDSSGKRSVVPVPFTTSGNLAFMAFRGAAANEIIERLAGAPRTVSASFGVAEEGGYALVNVTRFSAAGSADAIRSVVIACKR